MAIEDDIRKGLGLCRHLGNHIKHDKKLEVCNLLGYLLENQVVYNIGRRGQTSLENRKGHPEVQDLYCQ